MDPADLLDVVAREAAAFAEALRSTDAGVPVAGCPGWSLADLGRHLGGVHRWARAALGTEPSDEPPREGPSSPADDADLPAWIAEGAAELVGALRDADPDRPCWTMAPPATARFWLRRQAHETTLHRWDAQQCLGAATPIAGDVALDALDESIAMLLPRQVRLGRLPKASEVIHLVAGDTRFVITSDDRRPDAPPLAVVSGAPDTLLLLLWGRLGPDDERVHVDGDVETTRALLHRPLTP
ncbi:MAG: maleylpyruvate isomerase family mycothiol-dependent enzyme [Marmoricola sp.]